MKHILVSFVSLTLIAPFLLVPVFASAQTPQPPTSSRTDTTTNGELIPCGNDYDGNHVVVGSEECGFNDLIQLINNIIKWLLKISTLIATGVFVYAGILLLTSGGNPGAMTKAKGMLFKVLIGYVIILIAWLAVYTIVNALVKPDSKFDFIGAVKK